MPLRSSGCFACRKRKIRCDEGRPGCQRCATHGIPCAGYRGDKNVLLEFRDQTDVTVSRARGELKRGSTVGKEDGDGKGKGKGAEAVVKRAAGGGTPAPERTTTTTPAGESFQEGDVEILPRTTGSGTNETSSVTSSSRALITVPGDDHFVPRHRRPLHNGLPVLASPNVERARLYQGFIDHYLPSIPRQAAEEGHFGFFQVLALNRYMQPALRHGFDALSLVQIGSAYRDEAVLRQATTQYALALRALTATIARGDVLQNDDVLAAVVVLSACELYEGIQVEGNGWTNHVRGANQLVAARGPESLQSELALLLYINMRHASMCNALIERKAPFMASREWRNVAWRVPVKKDQSILFYDWAIQAPGLLERHDNLDLGSGTALAELDAVLSETAEIEHELRKWFVGWKAIAEMEHGALAQLVPITEFAAFVALCDDTAFTVAYRFPDFLIGYLQTIYWMTMHFLRENTQSLHRKRHQLLPDWYPEPGDEVQEDELLGYILDLCQSVPFFCEPESGSTGSIGIFLPLRTAAKYLRAHGHWRLLRWIGCVRNNVFVRGLRPPAVDGKPISSKGSPKSCSTGSPPDG